MKEKIYKIAEEIEAKLIAIRRELHQYPEVASKEERTSQIITSYLKQIDNLEITEHAAEGTGIIAVLKGERQNGKCVLLRADIDALPVTEKVETDYVSKNIGYMHACGHDAHATWIIGASMILSKLRDEISGTVKFVFQPGEEKGMGAKTLIEKDGVLKDPKVDAAFAAHVWPTIRSGKIAIASKYAFGCVGGFSLELKGSGGHGSWPHRCSNPITAACQICSELQNVNANKIDPVEPRVISVGAIHAGEKGVGNIIPDMCTISGTMRATSKKVIDQMGDEIHRVAEGISKLHGLEHNIKVHFGINAVENNKELVKLSYDTIIELMGKNSCEVLEKSNLGGENFAEFSSRVPGCYIFVGTATDRTEGKFELHSPYFEIDEKVLASTAAIMSFMTVNYLDGEILSR